MRNILLLDPSIATSNIGDEIIKDSIEKNFSELFENDYIYRLPTHTKTYTWYQRLLDKKNVDLFGNAALKFFCGTNALYANMLRPMPTWNINIFDAGIYKDTILLGVGLGRNANKANLYTKLLYNGILSKKYVHSVRDESTKKYLESIGIKAINTGCPTIWGLTDEFCKGIPTQKSDSCIFTLTHYKSDPINDKMMIEIVKRHYKDVYFWPQCIEDLNYLKRLVDTTQIHIVPANLRNYDQILSTKPIDYIGNRLHGGIFAIQHKVRSIIIAIDYRAEAMHENYAFPCIKRNNIPDELENMICSVWSTNINVDQEKILEWKKQFYE